MRSGPGTIAEYLVIGLNIATMSMSSGGVSWAAPLPSVWDGACPVTTSSGTPSE